MIKLTNLASNNSLQEQKFEKYTEVWLNRKKSRCNIAHTSVCQ